METNELKMIVEGALMASGRPLSINQLGNLFDENGKPSNEQFREALAALAEDCEGRAFELKEVGSGFRFQVRSHYGQWVSKLWEEKPARYSRALLETLALIAYRQPITRGEVEEVRGVAVSTNIIRTLLERDWVRVVGHRDVPGKPAMYATTKTFLDYFNLKSLNELPTLAEIKDITALNKELELEPDKNAQAAKEAAATDENADGADQGEQAAAGEGEAAQSEQTAQSDQTAASQQTAASHQEATSGEQETQNEQENPVEAQSEGVAESEDSAQSGSTAQSDNIVQSDSTAEDASAPQAEAEADTELMSEIEDAEQPTADEDTESEETQAEALAAQAEGADNGEVLSEAEESLDVIDTEDGAAELEASDEVLVAAEDAQDVFESEPVGQDDLNVAAMAMADTEQDDATLVEHDSDAESAQAQSVAAVDDEIDNDFVESSDDSGSWQDNDDLDGVEASEASEEDTLMAGGEESKPPYLG
jgi:segregation and condensation protein B